MACAQSTDWPGTVYFGAAWVWAELMPKLQLMPSSQSSAYRLAPLLWVLFVTIACIMLLANAQLPGQAAPLQIPKSNWDWPLSPKPQVRGAFAPPAKPWLSGHRGVDLQGTEGAAVLAPTTGVITYSGFLVDRGVITLTTPDGLKISFEPVISPLKVGQTVTQGQSLGVLTGKSHCASAQSLALCLHWGVRRGESYLNPLQFVGDLRPSILLPLGDLYRSRAPTGNRQEAVQLRRYGLPTLGNS